MPMQNPKELFIFELQDIYDAEQRIVQMLPLMSQESSHAEVKSAFDQHEQETKQQILNLEQCFQALGVAPQRAACHVIAGIKQEHDSFLKEKPASNILEMFDLGGAAKTENYEIASYKGLIDKANLMGQQQCVQLLQKNLSQEEAMMKKVEMITHQLSQQMLTQA